MSYTYFVKNDVSDKHDENFASFGDMVNAVLKEVSENNRGKIIYQMKIDFITDGTEFADGRIVLYVGTKDLLLEPETKLETDAVKLKYLFVESLDKAVVSAS